MEQMNIKKRNGASGTRKSLKRKVDVRQVLVCSRGEVRRAPSPMILLKIDAMRVRGEWGMLAKGIGISSREDTKPLLHIIIK